MTINKPVSALLFPNLETQEEFRRRTALNAYAAFVCSRLKADAACYRNASFFVAGNREKESLATLCNEKIADIRALDHICPQPTDIAEEHFETQSYAQYILDVDFELLLDLSAVFHFAYRREYKTLDILERLEKSADQSEPKGILSDAIRRQRQSILRLDAKIAAAPAKAHPTYENRRTSLNPIRMQ